MKYLTVVRAAVGSSVVLFALSAFAADPLPSWNDTAPKQAIIEFVDKVTRQGSPDFVPAAERIATFDNDGTLGLPSITVIFTAPLGCTPSPLPLRSPYSHAPSAGR